MDKENKVWFRAYGLGICVGLFIGYIIGSASLY